MSEYNQITVDLGALQINDNKATWRKLVPTADDQVVVSNSSLPLGAEWIASTNLKIDQTQVMCEEVSATISVDTDNFYVSGLENSTVVNIVSTANVNLLGIDHAQAPQCQIILYNNGSSNIILQHDSSSIPSNGFSFFPNQVTLQPREAINLYYNKNIQRYMMVSHL